MELMHGGLEGASVEERDASKEQDGLEQGAGDAGWGGVDADERSSPVRDVMALTN